MRYLLDSDSLSDLYNSDAPGHAAIVRRLTTLPASEQVVISILALYEMEYGYANAPDRMKAVIRQRISHIHASFEILPLTPEAAQLFGTLKAGLSKIRGLGSKGMKLHNIDLMTAATAATEDCTLVSADLIYEDVQKIGSELRVENWRI